MDPTDQSHPIPCHRNKWWSNVTEQERERERERDRPIATGIHMCDMNRLYVWHESFICVTWIIYMCDATEMYDMTRVCDTTHFYLWHDPWHNTGASGGAMLQRETHTPTALLPAIGIYMCDMTHLHVWSSHTAGASTGAAAALPAAGSWSWQCVVWGLWSSASHRNATVRTVVFDICRSLLIYTGLFWNM